MCSFDIYAADCKARGYFFLFFLNFLRSGNNDLGASPFPKRSDEDQTISVERFDSRNSLKHRTVLSKEAAPVAKC
jgi:hypothetical protein